MTASAGFVLVHINYKLSYKLPSTLIVLSEESAVLLLWLQHDAWATWVFTVVVLWLHCVRRTLFTLCYDAAREQQAFPL